jgi:beta-lactamase superfamily II metal-dependent hydrolase
MKIPRRLRLVLTLLLAAPLAHANEKTKTLDVTWIDSEGGGSTLIVTPAGESVLIDTGNPGGRDSARIVAAAKAAGLSKIDYLLITHWHVDHFGGAAEIAQQIPFGTIYERAIPTTDPDGHQRPMFVRMIQPYREITARRESLAPGVVVPLQQAAGAPKLELRCIAADKKVIAPTGEQRARKFEVGELPAPKVETDPDNDNSAVFVLTFGGFKFFDGGDLTWNYEPQLVTPYNVVGQVDVYQTNHHGLDRSNNPILVHALAPTVVVMNNGPRKGGQHETLATLASTPSVQARYQMHKSFNVPAEENAPADCIANDGDLRGPEAAKCPANVIRMTVAPGAKTYSVAVGSGAARTFQTKG